MSDQEQPTKKKSSAWKWILGIGCGCLVLVLGGMALMGGAAYWGMGKMMEAQPIQDAVAEAEANPDVVSALGTPLEPSFDFTGQSGSQGGMQSSSSETRMNLVITVEGPKGSAPIRVDAGLEENVWVHSMLEIELDDQTIDLLTDGYDPMP